MAINTNIKNSLIKACNYYWKKFSPEEYMLIFKEDDTYFLCSKEQKTQQINIIDSTNILSLFSIPAKKKMSIKIVTMLGEHRNIIFNPDNIENQFNF